MKILEEMLHMGTRQLPPSSSGPAGGEIRFEFEYPDKTEMRKLRVFSDGRKINLKEYFSYIENGKNFCAGYVNHIHDFHLLNKEMEAGPLYVHSNFSSNRQLNIEVGIIQAFEQAEISKEGLEKIFKLTGVELKKIHHEFERNIVLYSGQAPYFVGDMELGEKEIQAKFSLLPDGEEKDVILVRDSPLFTELYNATKEIWKAAADNIVLMKEIQPVVS